MFGFFVIVSLTTASCAQQYEYTPFNFGKMSNSCTSLVIFIFTGSINGDQYAQNGQNPRFQQFGRQRVYGRPNFIQRQQSMFQSQQTYIQPQLNIPQVLRTTTGGVNPQKSDQSQQPEQYPHAILGPNGVPLETPEVIAARELHFQLKMLAEMRNKEERMRRKNRYGPPINKNSTSYVLQYLQV
nr:unnamed protein product [Callosobruchus chinensis]